MMLNKSGITAYDMLNKSGITAYNIVELNKQLHQGGILHLTSLARKKTLSLLAVEKVHQYPVASPLHSTIRGRTFFKCPMYRLHFSTLTVLQNRRIPWISSSLDLGFTSRLTNS